MATHKLLLDDNLGYDFLLIAIHTSIEAYKLAFLLNKNLGLKLSRTQCDLMVDRKLYSADFSLFEYENTKEHESYHLFNNKAKAILKNPVQGLFYNENEVLTSDLFINDLPKVDYFLKIRVEGNAFAKAKTLKQINSIPQIVTAYNVYIDQLKTKQNLIFE